MERPRPPEALFTRFLSPFEPSASAEEWIRATFIEGDGPLVNIEHEHLQQARIGVLWAARGLMKHMRSVVGQAEIPAFQGNGWNRGRQEQQMCEWFGSVPDFILTFDAHFAAECTDAQWCALVEHELYHCGQEFNEFGSPKFKKDGSPSFAIRAHDVEEFIGVVRRYGASEAVASLVEAASNKPSIERAHIEGVCGACGLIL